MAEFILPISPSVAAAAVVYLGSAMLWGGAMYLTQADIRLLEFGGAAVGVLPPRVGPCPYISLW